MTDSEKDDLEGLPTAGYRGEFEREHLDSNGVVLSKNPPLSGTRDDLKQVDELVRRSDVKALIQDKIENYTDNLEKMRSEKQLILEELLEELEQ